MLTVTKEFVWDCAHMLDGHLGLCRNVHGHTYRMQVEVTSSDGLKLAGPSKGMVMDFSDLKSIVKELIVDPVDHAFVSSGNGSNVKETAVTSLLSELGMKVAFLGDRPTAENMARIFAGRLAAHLDDNYSNIKLVSVTVWETPTSFAKYVVQED